MPHQGTTLRILIAGIGNIFWGDDAFGCAVAGRLSQQVWPEGVRVVDFNIRGIDLMYALMDGYDLTILIDAMSQGGTPGTLYTIEPDLNALTHSKISSMDCHTLDPLKVLQTVGALGGSCQRFVLVGCEPEDLGGEEGRMGLSETVEASVAEASRRVKSLVNDFLTKDHSFTSTIDGSPCGAKVSRSANHA